MSPCFHVYYIFKNLYNTLQEKKRLQGCFVQGRVSAVGEDFFIEVSPGTYAVTASMPESQQQTQMISVRAGESVDLTFNL